MDYDQSGAETFTLAGTGALTVTVSRSNTTLLPDANITDASNCTGGKLPLTLTPASGQSDTATVSSIDRLVLAAC